MTDPLDPEAVDQDYPYCEAMPGMGPHNYQPALDLTGGTGMLLFCTQCGDYFSIDGTAPQAPLNPSTTPTGGTGTAPTPAPSPRVPFP